MAKNRQSRQNRQKKQSPPIFPGLRDTWNGYERYDFDVGEQACYVVVPKKMATGKPWLWRARFWGHEPQTDLALLEKGFHVVYMDVVEMFGNAEAVGHWNEFYRFLTGEHGFAWKASLECMSRGALVALNWAAENTDRVACIYADAPVCDIRSWPGGRGVSEGSPEDWEFCLKAYGLTDEQADTFADNPIDHLEPLARAGIPLLVVCGADDTDVPVDENTRVLEERYKALGGSIDVIMKPDCGHHPHSLPDPAPIVEFILRHSMKD